jgi:hypothetical protein
VVLRSLRLPAAINIALIVLVASTERSAQPQERTSPSSNSSRSAATRLIAAS